MRTIGVVALLAGAGLSACGLDRGGLLDGPGGGHDAGAIDATSSGSGGGKDAQGDGTDATDATRDAPSHDGPIDAPHDVVNVDSAVPCLGTTTSCGPPGQCVDCTSSSLGPVCVGGAACGCLQPSDCPVGQTCSSQSTCSTSCVDVLTCNGGCCDQINCQPGTANDACGVGGGVCQICRDPTPTCAAGGACISACGSTGCANDPAGSACIGGACGCSTDADCTSATNGQKCIGPACGCNNDGECSLGTCMNPAHTCG